MSLIAALMNDSVVIERPGAPTRDSTGSYVPGPPEFITVTGATVASPYGVAVGSSSEETDASETVITRRVLLAPVGTDVRASDRIRHGGRVWEVVGTPLVLPLTSLAHVEAVLREVTG
ncbi:head-tail adaptor protein [Streptomyces sp. C10-9-1]|uniref:head-tail adaptor protein n=1 Tax=Streptomyces sp. C10-9-1 TaxID=1859285 RepID=UPI0021121CBA|nr:head-tail adaptor protein [Streptomyces sp. C10-9-1]MCQ6554796.1 head-tail adaptor protein [Streptomyces sp. C10-9-1]